MNLAELITAHRDGRSYDALSRDCGDHPSGKRIQQLVTGIMKSFPDADTLTALSRGLRVSEAVVVLAAAESLGMDVRRPSARLLDLLPAGANRLSEQQAAAIAHLVRTIVDPVREGGEGSDDLEPAAMKRRERPRDAKEIAEAEEELDALIPPPDDPITEPQPAEREPESGSATGA